jgi:hypothetical protein
MRPLSPTRNRETYVYVREHVPPSIHTPSDSSSTTYIDDSADAVTLHAQRVSNPLDPLRISSFLQQYARNPDETFVSTPVSIASAFINVPLPAHMRRPLSFIRTQNVTPVRSTRPMINGNDDIDDIMNENDNDDDENSDDDIFAYERDPSDHRRWRRTRVAVVESTNVHNPSTPIINPRPPSPISDPNSDHNRPHSTSRFFRYHLWNSGASRSMFAHDWNNSTRFTPPSHESASDTPSSSSTSSSSSNGSVSTNDDNDVPPPLIDSDYDSDDVDNDHDMDDSDITDNSEDDG